MSHGASLDTMLCSVCGLPHRAAGKYAHACLSLYPMADESGLSIFPLVGSSFAGTSGQ